MLSWQKRRIGRTNLHVTALGVGTATLGGSRIDVSREESEAIIHAAWADGVRYVDTAPFYGVGAAERRVGDALRDKPREDWVLSTKVGRLLRPNQAAEGRDGRKPPLPFDVEYDYSYDGIMRSMEDSFQRLGLARIESSMCTTSACISTGRRRTPSICACCATADIARSTSCGAPARCRAIGIGVNEREACMAVMEFGQWDAFLLAGRYTLLEQAPLDDLIPKCLAAGTTLVIGGPLNSGILAGRDTWNYDAAPPEIVARVAAIRRVCESHGASLPAAALQFPLAHPVVSAIIPGPRNVDEFATNLKLLQHKIPAASVGRSQAGRLAPPGRAGAGRQRPVVHRGHLKKAAQFSEELVQPVVMHPVAGALDRDHLGRPEMPQPGRPPPGWTPSSPCRRPAASGR